MIGDSKSINRAEEDPALVLILRELRLMLKIQRDDCQQVEMLEAPLFSLVKLLVMFQAFDSTKDHPLQLPLSFVAVLKCYENLVVGHGNRRME